MLSHAEGRDFSGSCHAHQGFGVDQEERGGLSGTEERFEGGVGGGGGGVDLISHGS